MFDYRYHALSLAAVLLALAVGVVIGVAIGDSNLVSSAKNGIVHDLHSEVGAANRQAGQLRTQLSGEEAFANDLYPIAVHGLLSGRSVGLVFLGGSSNRVNGLVRDAVTQAGGGLATVVAVREPLDLSGIAREAVGTATPRSSNRAVKAPPKARATSSSNVSGALVGTQLELSGGRASKGAAQRGSAAPADGLRRAAGQAHEGSCSSARRPGAAQGPGKGRHERVRDGPDRRRGLFQRPGRRDRDELP